MCFDNVALSVIYNASIKNIFPHRGMFWHPLLLNHFWRLAICIIRHGLFLYKRVIDVIVLILHFVHLLQVFILILWCIKKKFGMIKKLFADAKLNDLSARRSDIFALAYILYRLEWPKHIEIILDGGRAKACKARVLIFQL